MSGAITTGESILGKYLIRELIGEGGMARVWLAEEIAFGKRLVAIKEPRSDLSPDEQTEMQSRFRKEVSVCAALEQANAPYIVRAITAEPYAQQLLLVMAYMPGGDLAQRIAANKEGMPIDQVIEIAESLLTALQAMYEHPMEIVHRDLKPSNVLFDSRGKAHLADFGVAQTATRTGVNTKLMGTAQVGTPLYMAPEQASNSGYLTPAADIFTLGCILFEMVTGKRYKRMRPGTRASQTKNDVPSWLDDLLVRALVEDPFDRYESAEEMLAALQSGAHQEAEKRRLAEEVEKRRLAEEAEKRRLAEEAEKRRLVEEALAKQRLKEAKQWFDQGLQSHRNKEYGKAIADKSKAISLDPKNASYYESRAITYDAQGERIRAEADRARAKELKS
jgi:serine/threonine protein kinase